MLAAAVGFIGALPTLAKVIDDIKKEGQHLLEVTNETDLVLVSMSSYLVPLAPELPASWVTAPDGVIPSRTTSVFSVLDGSRGAAFWDIRTSEADPQSTNPNMSKLKGTRKALAIYWDARNPKIANAFPFGGDMLSRDWAEFWFDHLSTTKSDPSSHYYPYTTTNSYRGHLDLSVSYSCDAGSNSYTLTQSA